MLTTMLGFAKRSADFENTQLKRS